MLVSSDLYARLVFADTNDEEGFIEEPIHNVLVALHTKIDQFTLAIHEDDERRKLPEAVVVRITDVGVLPIIKHTLRDEIRIPFDFVIRIKLVDRIDSPFDDSLF